VIQEPSDPGFVSDLRASFRVIRDRPLLPIISLVVWTVPAALPSSAGFIGFPLNVFAVGFVGTQRLWFLRGFSDLEMTFGEAFSVSWKYLWRFVVLGLIAAPVVIIGVLIGIAATRNVVGIFLGLGIATLILDLAFTFVTPALAFVTRRASKAVSIGVRLISSDWPRTLLYVLVPPLAIVILGNALFISGAVRDLDQQFDAIRAGRPPPPIRVSLQFISAGLTAAGTLLGLWFKGATAAFFLRRFDVGPNGSAGPAPPPRPDATGLPLPPPPDTTAPEERVFDGGSGRDPRS
jgi:hypothetical protein